MAGDGGSLKTAAVKRFIGNVANKTTKSGLIWLQGIITDVNLPQNEITLADETGTIRVGNVNTSNPSPEWIKKGVYCMVIGAASDQSRVHSIKMTDLSRKPLEKQIWPKLVIHQENDEACDTISSLGLF